MVILKDILLNVAPLKVVGDTSMPITDLIIDSRKVKQGTVFIAIRGTSVDGHEYIDKAIANGASVIVCETAPGQYQEGVCYIQVQDTAKAAGRLADAFFGYPSSSMKVIGITGTNGKTTTATLLYRLFVELGHKCGLISTVQNHIGDTVETATHTTPDAISIQRLLAKMHVA